MLDGIKAMGIESLPWDDETRNFRARALFAQTLMRAANEDWPDFGDALERDPSWLAPFLGGITRRAQLTRLPLADALNSLLSYEQRRELDRLAPTHVPLPTGTRVRIDYLDEGGPSASMRMQEVFGLAATPRIGRGTVPVVFKLLSPGKRPLQVTRDLASFWNNAYKDVRKDMRGRYPRHYWPENPLEAEPTRRVKPRT
jgi:ATP-dependent helicase HrpB